MIKKVVINGQLDTLLVLTDENEYTSTNPFLEVLNNQEERIEALERQNMALLEQGEALINILNSSLEAKKTASEALESLKEAESALGEFEEFLEEERISPEESS